MSYAQLKRSPVSSSLKHTTVTPYESVLKNSETQSSSKLNSKTSTSDTSQLTKHEGVNLDALKVPVGLSKLIFFTFWRALRYTRRNDFRCVAYAA